MITNALLSFGVVLTTASQLRLPGIPLGVGEICLVLWLIIVSLRAVVTGRICNATALLRIGAFWVCLSFALSVGTCVAYLSQELDLPSMLHDAFAYLLVAAFTCLIVATMETNVALRQTQWFLIVFWNIALVLQIAAGWSIISLPSVDPWYWDRFRGWAENPNQIALYCAVLTPLSLSLALSAKGFGRIAGSFSCLLTFIVGRLTKSDTFLVAMVTAVAVFFLLRLRSWLTSPQHRFSLRSVVAVLVIVAAVPLALTLAPYAVATADEFEGLAISLAKDRGGEATKRTASLRVQLWEDALHRGLKAGSLGLGPGPHLEKPNVADNRLLPTPFEAHSTLFDIFTQGGLLAVIAVCSLFASAFLLAFRAKLDALAALFVALAIFSISHFILRHPIVWFAFALGLILGSAPAPSPHTRIGS
ncbi:O-antigen ligase family protein [Tardiphaga sp.]|uniref:O-antigen ligase family protein n=1 Tax=Tardiphaga sp. TaxID=1926292 RepID=UPI00352B6DC5